MDLFPTILEMVGRDAANDPAVDGVSLVPVLEQSGELPERSLFWHYPHYQHYQLEGTTPYGAIRRGDYRLVEYYHDRRVELYDLRADIAERNNIAASEQQLASSMQEELHSWLRSVDAQMPTPNPGYDPEKPEDLR